jgi:hypothetical protein
VIGKTAWSFHQGKIINSVLVVNQKFRTFRHNFYRPSTDTFTLRFNNPGSALAQ